jgi:hypothetical protein
MSGTNYLSDYNLLGPSKGGVGASRPWLSDVVNSEGLQPMNLFFQFTSAWIGVTGAGGTGYSTSLWNGDTVAVGTGFAAGECDFAPEPAMFCDAVGLYVMVFVTPLAGHATGDYYVVTKTVSANLLTSIKVKWFDSTDTAKDSVVFQCLAIGARKTVKLSASGTPVSLTDQICLDAISGGAQA